jgi:hypothetical protein
VTGSISTVIKIRLPHSLGPSASLHSFSSIRQTKAFCSWGFLCNYKFIKAFLCHGATALSGPRPPHCWGLIITLRHITLGWTPLDEWSAERRDLYPTTRNTHKRQTSMPPTGFESTIPESERPQTHTLNRASTGIDIKAVQIPVNNASPSNTNLLKPIQNK